MSPVNSFVHHLDNNEFIQAKEFLDLDVIYKFRGKEIIGADNVIGCYQGSYESVEGQLDEIILESEIIDLGSDRYRTNYIDILFKNGKQHTHRCYQVLQFSKGKIKAIEHFDIDGEVQLLETFFKENGIIRK